MKVQRAELRLLMHPAKLKPLSLRYEPTMASEKAALEGPRAHLPAEGVVREDSETVTICY